MLLGGLQKTTLIDYPGKVACTVFTVGCNFRCPFCHNKNLVTGKLFASSGLSPLSESEFFSFLSKRQNILDGVCITGGEPTLQSGLPEFITKIKSLGFLVKLDTNGSNPEMLKKLNGKKLLDYIAMDVKSIFGDYSRVIGTKNDETKIKKSMILIVKSGIEFEFRTTVVPGLHAKDNLIKLAEELKLFNDHIVWFLQGFRPQGCLSDDYLKIAPYSANEMKRILKAVKNILPLTKLRGTN